MEVLDYFNNQVKFLEARAAEIEQYVESKSCQDDVNESSNIATAPWLDSWSGILAVIRLMKQMCKELCKMDSLSQEELEKEYSSDIEISRSLGEKGWVISGRLAGDYFSEWSQLLDKADNDSIVEYFERKDSNVLEGMINDLRKGYADAPENMYFSYGTKYFHNGEYTTSAMFLLGLLDYRFSVLVDFPVSDKRKHLTVGKKYSEEGVSKQKKLDFIVLTDGKSIRKKMVYFTEWYPSLIAYMNRTFVDGTYYFESGKEPPYLNRNWLLHGRMKREVERYECIQLLNALDMVEMMFNSDYVPNI